MKDIADSMGISTVTVSKALNNKEGVSQELKEKIQEKAREMGYVYNPIPKLMLKGLTNNVGIIVSKKFLVRGYDFYFQIYETIIDRLANHGYYGILEVLSKQAEFDCEVPRVLRESRVDGVIVLGQISKPYLEMISSQKVPFVLLDFYGGYENMDSVVTDNFYGSYLITSYLYKMGHRKIGFVGNYLNTSSTLDRYMGYLKALIENEIGKDIEKYTVFDKDLSNGGIELDFPQEMPTAFVCKNDKVANAFISKLKEQGYRVPEDVSVVGFDNFDRTDKYSMGITTVEVDFITMAQKAVELIIAKIKDPSYNQGRILINCRLVIKESVKDLQK